MLYHLGALRIEVAPFNVQEVMETGKTDHAVKGVVGAEQPLEYVGDGENAVTLDGRLFPEALGGGSGLTILHAMRASGRPQYLMRGDGRPLGWHATMQAEAQGRRVPVVQAVGWHRELTHVAPCP